MFLINRICPLVKHTKPLSQVSVIRTYIAKKPLAEIVQARLDYPQLSKYGAGILTAAHDVFIRHGYTTPKIIQLFRVNPNVPGYSPEDIANRLEIWRGMQFGEVLTRQLILQCPEILDIDNEDYIKQRMAEIITYAGKRKNIWRILMASPNVLVEDITLFKKKYNYIQGVMNVDVSDAVKSGIFSHSIDKIRNRHLLMVRLGIYKKRPKNLNPMDPNKNPRMHRIVDSTDEMFAKKICGISLLEFETFVALHSRELRNKRQKTGRWQVDNLDDSDIESSDSEDELDEYQEDVDDIANYESECLN